MEFASRFSRLLILHLLDDRGGGLAELNHHAGDVTNHLGEMTGRDVVAGSGVDGLGGAVLVVDLHGSRLEVAEVVGGAPLGAAGELRRDLNGECGGWKRVKYCFSGKRA